MPVIIQNVILTTIFCVEKSPEIKPFIYDAAYCIQLLWLQCTVVMIRVIMQNAHRLPFPDVLKENFESFYLECILLSFWVLGTNADNIL